MNDTQNSREVPHRKNAAERLMWLCLLPFVPIAIVLEKIRSYRKSS